MEKKLKKKYTEVPSKQILNTYFITSIILLRARGVVWSSISARGAGDSSSNLDGPTKNTPGITLYTTL